MIYAKQMFLQLVCRKTLLCLDFRGRGIGAKDLGLHVCLSELIVK